jgi:hypothetical protein
MSFGVVTYPLKMCGRSTENVTITASYAGQDVQAPQLSVTNPKIQSLSISPNPVDAEQDTHGVVTMDRPVAVLTTINLASNSQKRLSESSAIILPGQTTSGQFVIHTVVGQLPPVLDRRDNHGELRGPELPGHPHGPEPGRDLPEPHFSQNPAWGPRTSRPPHPEPRPALRVTVRSRPRARTSTCRTAWTSRPDGSR